MSEEMRGGSTNHFTLCNVYLVFSISQLRHNIRHWVTALSVSGVEDYKYITMTTCRNDDVMGVRNN